MKHFNYVATVETNGKFFSYPLKAAIGENLKAYIEKEYTK